MNSFKDKFDQYLRAKEVEANSKKSAASEAEKNKLTFENQFTFEADRIARPIFEEFVSDANEKGFSAKYAAGKDGNGNEYLSVHFVPKHGAKFSSDKRSESVFVLRCHGDKQKVAHVMYYDQRVEGDKGKKSFEYGLPSIKEDTIRRELFEFMELSLKSWESA